MTDGILSPLLVGPAVIVDDKVYLEDSDVQDIMHQIEEAHIPLVRMKVLPNVEQVRHWAGFSMIVLDWELLSRGGETDRDQAGGDVYGGDPTESGDPAHRDVLTDRANPTLAGDAADGDSAEGGDSADGGDPDDDPGGGEDPIDGDEGGLTDEGGAEEDFALGLVIPDSLREENDRLVAQFVLAILDEIYCPIFIVSNLGADEVKRRLQSKLGDDPRIDARVMVRGKADLQTGLWSDLDAWIKSHPAVYALKAWEAGYDAAKHRLFAEFESMSVNWPGIMWSTFEADSVNQHLELAETLNRNILYRMTLLEFDSDAITSVAEGDLTRASLHKVLHAQAVVPADQIPPDVVMQGDFYFADAGDGSPPDEILINLTAACDLVARNGVVQQDMPVRLAVARPKSVPTSNNKLKDLRFSDGTSAVVHFFTSYGIPYEVSFTSHREWKFGDIPHPRRGRLLAPYITQLFQAFALYLLRPGVPRLPEGFYFDPPAKS